MIAPLRSRHRWLTATLAVAVPVLYIVALAARPGEPVTERLPAALMEAPAGDVGDDFGELVTEPAVAVRSRTDGSTWWLELDPREPIVRPEVLIYWTPSSGAIDRLPGDATLIGGLAGDRARAFALHTALHGAAQHFLLVFGRQVLEPVQQHEAVELSLRQFESARLLDRVLRGDHQKRRRQFVRCVADRGLPFLHRFE